MPVEKGQVAVYKVFGPKEGKFGEFYNHWFKLEGQDGGFGVRFKDDRPRAKEGDSISFQYQQNGQYKNVDAKSLEVTGGNGGNPASGAGNYGAVSRNGAGDSNGNGDRQEAIMRQSAMGYAATLVASMTTMHSSSPEELAETTLWIADEFFLPYAKHGRTEQKERKLEEDNNRARQAASDEADFDDPIDF